MRKKIAIRQPDEQTSKTADEWVSGGRASQPALRPAANATDKLARLTIDLPPELHGRFKAACAQQRTKMKDEVLRFIEEWTRKA